MHECIYWLMFLQPPSPFASAWTACKSSHVHQTHRVNIIRCALGEHTESSAYGLELVGLEFSEGSSLWNGRLMCLCLWLLLSILAADDWATHTFVQGLEPACGRAKYLRFELEINFSEKPDFLAWQLLWTTWKLLWTINFYFFNLLSNKFSLKIWWRTSDDDEMRWFTSFSVKMFLFLWKNFPQISREGSRCSECWFLTCRGSRSPTIRPSTNGLGTE